MFLVLKYIQEKSKSFYVFTSVHGFRVLTPVLLIFGFWEGVDLSAVSFLHLVTHVP